MMLLVTTGRASMTAVTFALLVLVVPSHSDAQTQSSATDAKAFAYQLQEYQVVGGAAWLASSRFDIVAKAPEGQGVALPTQGRCPPRCP